MDNLSPIVIYPAKILQKIGNDETVLKLLANKADVSVDSPEAEQILKNHLFDFDYVDNTVQESGAFICVEADMQRVSTDTMADWVIYINVYCHKNFMKLDPLVFPKMVGNRRDNLVKAISEAVDGFNVLGIGTLKVQNVHTVNAPDSFSAREIKCPIPDFAKR